VTAVKTIHQNFTQRELPDYNTIVKNALMYIVLKDGVNARLKHLITSETNALNAASMDIRHYLTFITEILKQKMSIGGNYESDHGAK
jgi:hypothetical protein